MYVDEHMRIVFLVVFKCWNAHDPVVPHIGYAGVALSTSIDVVYGGTDAE